jgi:hypothetical protein
MLDTVLEAENAVSECREIALEASSTRIALAAILRHLDLQLFIQLDYLSLHMKEDEGIGSLKAAEDSYVRLSCKEIS